MGVSYHKNTGRRATREHLVPRSLGGGNEHNVVLACAACNHKRQSDMGWVPFAWLREQPDLMETVPEKQRARLRLEYGWFVRPQTPRDPQR